jgi:hypothetical protein
VKGTVPSIHSRVHYIGVKDDSFISDRPYRERLAGLTGTRLGGPGGGGRGQVTEDFVDGGHSLSLYRPRETAQAVADWLGGPFKAWWGDEERRRCFETPTDPVNFPPGFMERMKKSRL